MNTDHLNSNVIVVWGRNPAVTDIHLWRILREAQRNGTKLVVVDPVETKTARYADLSSNQNLEEMRTLQLQFQS